jgi:hypothetical protein
MRSRSKTSTLLLGLAVAACSSSETTPEPAATGGAAGAAGTGGAGATSGTSGAGGTGGAQCPALAACASETAEDRAYAPTEEILGASYEIWAQRFRDWFARLPATGHPLYGGACGQRQDADVWFLPRPVGCALERSCTVPAGRPIFVPLATSQWTTGPDVERCYPEWNECGGQSSDLAAWTKGAQDECATFLGNAAEFCLEVDGKAVANSDQYRFVTDLFQVEGHPDDPVNLAYTPYGEGVDDCGPLCVPGDWRHQVECGWWVILKPLSPGKHTIRWYVISPDEQSWNDVTYEITVEGVQR